VDPTVPGGSSAPKLVKDRAGRTVFGGSVAPTDRAGSVAAEGPSAPTSARNLWSGLSDRRGDRGSEKAGAAVPGLADSALPGAAPGWSRLAVVGTSILAIGLVTMLAGFLVATMRRRRASAPIWPLS
jgi:hypothetical protein